MWFYSFFIIVSFLLFRKLITRWNICFRRFHFPLIRYLKRMYRHTRCLKLFGQSWSRKMGLYSKLRRKILQKNPCDSAGWRYNHAENLNNAQLWEMYAEAKKACQGIIRLLFVTGIQYEYMQSRPYIITYLILHQQCSIESLIISCD